MRATSFGLHALGLRATLTVDHAGLDRYLRDAFAHVGATVHAPEHRLEVCAGDRGAGIALDGRETWCGEAGDLAVELTRIVNRLVVWRSGTRLLVHAAVARLGGQMVVLPGPPDAGKSTLVTGLVRAGWEHLSDELAPVDPGTAEIAPYPRAIGLEGEARFLFPELRPEVEAAVDPYLARRWLVAPSAVGRVATAGGPATLLVFPRHEPRAETRLEWIRPAHALQELVTNTVNLGAHGRPGFRTLARVVRGARCARLVSGDLARAVDEVTGAAR